MIYDFRLTGTLTGTWGKRIAAVCLVLTAAIALPAQDGRTLPDAVKFKTLVNFDGTNGLNPQAPLVQGADGSLYGTAYSIYTGSGGNIFKMTPEGSLTVLYNFCAQPNCADGSIPNGLVLGRDGSLYGTTEVGGVSTNPGCGGCGTFFKISHSGKLTTIYNFCALANCTDGAYPNGLVLGADGNFYGTSEGGGSTGGYGTIFRITPGGVLTTLYSFCAETNCTDGGVPLDSPIQATDGNLYGTTQLSGANGGGTIFKLTPKGMLATLYSFCAQPNCTDGSFPQQGPLVQGANGNFYGTTRGGGANPNP